MKFRRRKRNSEGDTSLAFLDIVSCSFGAIVLLLLIVKVTAPEPIDKDLLGSAEYQAIVKDLQSKAEEVKKILDAQKRKIEAQKQKIAHITERLGKAQKAAADSGIASMVNERLKDQFEAALQELNDEMRAIEVSQSAVKIGGIPADSKHIIFIIDTSGSMQNPRPWNKMQEQMTAILDAYPRIEGIQVLNDMGEHLFSGYKGRWLKDTPTMRRNILAQLSGWREFSNSNPVEGIYQAISLYARKTQKLSIYIIGDDFSGSIQTVLNEVDQLNQRAGTQKIRIHAIGLFTPNSRQTRGYYNFAGLSALTRKNRGTFIGVSTTE